MPLNTNMETKAFVVALYRAERYPFKLLKENENNKERDSILKIRHRSDNQSIYVKSPYAF